MRDVQLIIGNFLNDRQRHKKYLAVLLALSMLVSFIVPLILMKPADSTTGILVCTKMEHKHGNECYLLDCDEEHGYSLECMTLICTAEEHTHSDECYSSPEQVEAVAETTEATTETTELTTEAETTEISTEETTEESTEATVEETTEESTEETTEETTEEANEEEEIYEMTEEELAFRNLSFKAFEVFKGADNSGDKTSGQYWVDKNLKTDSDSIFQGEPGALLGVASHFHVFANEVSMQSHVHGNIATNLLHECGAFGVYNNKLNGMSSTNYIRYIKPGCSLHNAYQTQLVVGSDYTVWNWFGSYNLNEIGNPWGGNSIPFSKFGGNYKPQVITEKPDKPYININKELAKFKNMSETIAKGSKIGSKVDYVDISGAGGGNNQNDKLTLDVKTDAKYVYQTITAADLNMQGSNSMKEMRIKGLNKDQVLFLTIDLGDAKNAYFNKSWLVEDPDGGGTFGTGESPLGDGGCRVIYNFVNSSGADDNKTYTAFNGNIVLGERRNGAILAPEASVNGAGNTNGTFICKKFVATGETHRLDVLIEGEEEKFPEFDVENPPQLYEETVKPPTPTINITVQKTWENDNGTNHNNNFDYVKVQLYEEVNETWQVYDDVKTLNYENGWKAVWNDLPEGKYKAEEVEYYTSSGKVYTTEYSNNENDFKTDGTITITNTEKKTKIDVSKVWIGTQGNEKQEVTVKLYRASKPNLPIDSNELAYANKELKLNIGNQWKDSFTDLESQYYYYVKETSIEGYTTSYTNNGIKGGTIVVTNTKKIQPTIKFDINIKKVWNDNDNHSGDSVTVQLYQVPSDSISDNSKWSKVDGFTATLSNPNWSCKFTDVPHIDGIVYFVKEDSYSVSNNVLYTSTDTNPVEGINNNTVNKSVTITNQKQTMSYTVKKRWTDNESIHSNEEVTVQLYKSTNGTLNLTGYTEKQIDDAIKAGTITLVREAKLNSDNIDANGKSKTPWQHTFEDLDKGDSIYYYIYEVPFVSDTGYDYVPTYSETKGKNNTSEITITNDKKIKINVNKVWSDGNDKHNETITVGLYKSFVGGLDVNDNIGTDMNSKMVLVDSVEISKDQINNNISHTFDKLDIKDNGRLIYYYIKEEPVQVNGKTYAIEYSQNGICSINKDLTIYNVQQFSLEVRKQWFNADGSSATAPAGTTIKFRIYKYTETTTTTVLTSEGETTSETTTTAESEHPSNIKYIPTEAVMMVNSDYKLPENPTDEDKANQYIFTVGNDGTYTFPNLPTHENGQRIYYYIQEVVDENLAKEYNTYYGNGTVTTDEGFYVNLESGNKIIRNVKKADTEMSIKVSKVWHGVTDYEVNGYTVEDYENPVSQWKKPITVKLYQGTTADFTPDPDNPFKEATFTGEHTFTGLPMYVDNNPEAKYYYKIEEEGIYGYKAFYTQKDFVVADGDNPEKDFESTITNVLIKRNLAIEKFWYSSHEPRDNDVTSVTVQLYRKAVDEQPEISKENVTAPEGGGNNNNDSNLVAFADNVETPVITVSETDISNKKVTVNLRDYFKDYIGKTVYKIYITLDKAPYGMSCSRDNIYWNQTQGSTTHELSVTDGWILKEDSFIEFSSNDFNGGAGTLSNIKIRFDTNNADELNISFPELLSENKDISRFFSGSTLLLRQAVEINSDSPLYEKTFDSSDFKAITETFDIPDTVTIANISRIELEIDSNSFANGQIKYNFNSGNSNYNKSKSINRNDGTLNEESGTRTISITDGLENGLIHTQIYIQAQLESNSSVKLSPIRAIRFYGTGGTTTLIVTHNDEKKYVSLTGDLSSLMGTNQVNVPSELSGKKISSIQFRAPNSILSSVSGDWKEYPLNVYYDNAYQMVYLNNKNEGNIRCTTPINSTISKIKIDNQQSVDIEEIRFYYSSDTSVSDNGKEVTINPNVCFFSDDTHNSATDAIELILSNYIASSYNGRTITELVIDIEQENGFGFTADIGSTNAAYSNTCGVISSKPSYLTYSTNSNMKFYSTSNHGMYTVKSIKFVFDGEATSPSTPIAKSKSMAFTASTNLNADPTLDLIGCQNNIENHADWNDWKLFDGKTLSKIEVFSDADEVHGQDIDSGHTVNVYMRGNGTASGSGRTHTDGKTITYDYSNCGVVIHKSANGTNTSNEKNFLQGRFKNPNNIGKVVLTCTDGSTYTVFNSSYKAEVTTSLRRNEKIDDTKQVDTIKLIEAYPDKYSQFVGRKLVDVDIYFDKNLPTTSNGENNIHGRKFDMYWHKDSDSTKFYSVYPTHSGTNVAKYKMLQADKDNQIDPFETMPEDLVINIAEWKDLLVDKLVFNFDDGSTFTIKNTDYNPTDQPEETAPIHNTDSIAVNANSDLLNEWSGNYNQNYKDKTLTKVELIYGDTLTGLPGDTVTINNGTAITGSPSFENLAKVDYEVTTNNKNVTDMKINITNNEYHKDLTDLKQIILTYDDTSTYTITNSSHTPKVENPPTLDEETDFNTGEFVFIQEVTLTKGSDGRWVTTLKDLPVTDGQGHVYKYYIKEKSVSGHNAQAYTLLSYTDPDGKVLSGETNLTGLTNAKVGGEQGIIIMPSTGGEGTKRIYFIGGATMLCGIVGLFSLKRRRKLQ